jgi:hypothetical protein
MLELNLIKLLRMESKKLYKIITLTGEIRYTLAVSKYEAIEKVRKSDDYKYSFDFYKVTKKKI